MNNIEEKELREIKGGAINLGTGLLIAGAIVFIIGLIDGYVNPTTCKK